jgi:hypothetical protein
MLGQVIDVTRPTPKAYDRGISFGSRGELVRPEVIALDDACWTGTCAARTIGERRRGSCGGKRGESYIEEGHEPEDGGEPR